MYKLIKLDVFKGLAIVERLKDNKTFVINIYVLNFLASNKLLVS